MSSIVPVTSAVVVRILDTVPVDTSICFSVFLQAGGNKKPANKNIRIILLVLIIFG
jgi:hypothetical protein